MTTIFPSGTHPLEQEPIRRVLEIATQCGVKVYLVGGYLRDIFMGRADHDSFLKDLDYAVAGGPAIGLARRVGDEMGGQFVLLDETNDTARVVLADGVTLDFAGCSGGELRQDILRRDFTINALAWDPANPDEIVDLVGGLEDVRALKIRAIAEGNFVDDPLRTLRAFRFAAVLGCTIEARTYAMIERHSRLIAQVAPERINYELFIIMRSPAAGTLLKDMGDKGLLGTIFPELARTQRVPPNAFHHLGLWDHSLESVSQAEEYLKRLPAWVADALDKEASAGVSHLAITKLSCLLHDIGKPDTWAITPEGRHTFYGHDRLGAEMIAEIGERMRWSRPVERMTQRLVRWHLRPGQLFHQGPPTDRAVHRFFRQVGPDVPPLLVLAFGDFGATRGPGLAGPDREALEQSLLKLLDRYRLFASEQKKMVRWLDGHAVMRLLGIQPGPVLGELLEALAEAQGLNEVSSRAEAERFVIDRYRQKYSR